MYTFIIYVCVRSVKADQSELNEARVTPEQTNPRTHEHTNTRTHEHTNTRTHYHHVTYLNVYIYETGLCLRDTRSGNGEEAVCHTIRLYDTQAV